MIVKPTPSCLNLSNDGQCDLNHNTMSTKQESTCSGFDGNALHTQIYISNKKNTNLDHTHREIPLLNRL